MGLLGYPTIPLSAGFWKDKQSVKFNPIEVSTSEGGFVSRTQRDFYNKSRQSYSVSGVVQNRIAIDSFLKERNNRPFAFTPNPEYPEDEKLYICSDWSFKNLADPDKDICDFSATFTQVYRGAINVANPQGLDDGHVIYLFELTNFNHKSPYDAFRFTNNIGVTFQNTPYTPLACGVDKLTITSQGAQPELTLTVADENAVITKLLFEFKHIEGAKLNIKVTKNRYLDGGTFSNASITDRLITELDLGISRRQQHIPGNKVVFILGNAVDVEGISLPRRIALRKCVWRYRDEFCGYTGTRYFDRAGNPVLDRDNDACGKEINDCDKRLNTIRYGGMPALQRR